MCTGFFFCGSGVNRAYVDGKHIWFDDCEADTWSSLWLDDFVEEIGYERNQMMNFYWCLPGKDVTDGLRAIKNNSDANNMIATSERHKNLVIYVDHDNSLDDMWLT